MLSLSGSLHQAAAAEPVLIDDFSNGISAGWEPKIFKGETSYRVGARDNVPCLEAAANNSASGMFYKIDFDPEEYPVLSWSWQVDNILSKGDARTKAGDDYAARVYVVFPALFFWNTRALNYIWANRLGKGSAIKSSYTGNAVMIAVDSGNKNLGTWQHYRMNIREDFIKHFGYQPPRAGAVAIMTDTDNTGESASACFGPIRLIPAE